MKHKRKTWSFRDIIVAVSGIIIFAGFLYVGANYGADHFLPHPSQGSIEVGFTNLSPSGESGGEIIPASCPSYEHFLGECTSGPVPLVGPAHGTTVGFPHAHSGASVTDVDGDLSSYVWFFTLCPGVCPAITDETGALSGGSSPISGPTYTPNVAGEYWIALYVTDALGHYGVAYLVETAAPSGTLIWAATLDALPWSGTININGNVPYGATPPDYPVPTGTYSSSPTGLYTFTYSSGGPAGAVFQSVTPSGSQTLNAGGTITFTWNFVSNVAPVAAVGPAHATTVGTSHAHSGASATDANANLSSYSWSFVSCPGACPALSASSGAISGGASAVAGPTYTPNAAGSYTLRLTVTDSTALTGTADLVETSSLPVIGLSFSLSPAGPGVVTYNTTLRALITSYTGNPADTSNYSFWWNCANATTNVGTAQTACGILPADTAGDGICSTNAVGAKCNGESVLSKNVPHGYASGGTLSPKVIIERGPALPVEARTSLTVEDPLTATCAPSLIKAAPGEVITWSAFPVGGSPGNNTFDWRGTDNLTCAGQPSAACGSVAKVYTTVSPPVKSASTTVRSTLQTYIANCVLTVTVSYRCSNGIDDDGDGLVDYGLAPTNDPGCTSATDNDERNYLTCVSNACESKEGTGATSNSCQGKNIGAYCDPTQFDEVSPN